MPRGQTEALAPMVAAVMDEAGIAMELLDRLAATTGPGTFTGVRIGLAFARALAAALSLPLTGIGTLPALAAGWHFRQEGPVTAIMDARRGEVYMQSFTATGAALDAAAAIGLEEAAHHIPGDARALVGTGAPLVFERLAGGGKPVKAFLASAPLFPDARLIARLAAAMPVDCEAEMPSPVYLRAPDAKLPPASAVLPRTGS
jgi:tRNA threonylcarbamoyladenosine biosynthesis protein TsaB